MKKIFLGIIGLILMLSMSMVSAVYYQPGDVVELPYLSPGISADLDSSDGYANYVYCMWELDSPNDEKCADQFEIFGNCDSTDTGNYLVSTDSKCYVENYIGDPINITLTEGTTKWTTVVSSINMTFDSDLGVWIPGTPQIIDSVEVTYTTIPEPDISFIQSLIQALNSWICENFPFSWCIA